jgi:hypothetical protein
MVGQGDDSIANGACGVWCAMVSLGGPGMGMRLGEGILVGRV